MSRASDHPSRQRERDVADAVPILRERLGHVPPIAVILGSGLAGPADLHPGDAGRVTRTVRLGELFPMGFEAELT